MNCPKCNETLNIIENGNTIKSECKTCNYWNMKWNPREKEKRTAIVQIYDKI